MSFKTVFIKTLEIQHYSICEKCMSSNPNDKASPIFLKFRLTSCQKKKNKHKTDDFAFISNVMLRSITIKPISVLMFNYK